MNRTQDVTSNRDLQIFYYLHKPLEDRLNSHLQSYSNIAFGGGELRKLNNDFPPQNDVLPVGILSSVPRTFGLDTFKVDLNRGTVEHVKRHITRHPASPRLSINNCLQPSMFDGPALDVTGELACS